MVSNGKVGTTIAVVTLAGAAETLTVTSALAAEMGTASCLFLILEQGGHMCCP